MLLKLPRMLALASVAALALTPLLPHQPAYARSFVRPPHFARATTATTTTTATTATTATTMRASAFADGNGNDDPHAYFRPPAADTSGFPKNSHTYHRSPCPCLNTLANHGYLPRDGKMLTPQIVQDAIVRVFNIDPSLAAKLAAPLPPTFTLADLGEHNFIEHDASLVHDDAFFGRDPALVNATLAADLMARGAKKHKLTARTVAHFRADRERDCAANDPQYDFGPKRQATAYAESAALLLAMGDYASEAISVAHAQSFLVDERMPDDFTRSDTAVTTTKALALAAKIKFMASWPWSAAANE